MRNKDTMRIVATAMFIALVFVATFINVPFPGAVGGLVHLGTLVMLIIAMKFGKYYGAMAGGFGMALFDIMGGWLIWAPGTFIVRLLMGYLVGLIAFDKDKGQGGSLIKNMFAWDVGLIVMLVGYYLYEATFITTFQTALASGWGNMIQFAIGLLAIFFVGYTKRIKAFDDFIDKI